MKIAYINKTKWLSNIPGNVFSTLNTYGFAQNGVDSTLFMIENSGKIESDFEKFFDLPKIDKFHLKTFSKKKFLIKSNEFFYQKAYKFIYQNRDFDIVITRDPAFLPYLYKLKLKIGCKAIYQSHNFFLDLSLKDNPNDINAKRFHKLEKKYLDKIDGILALNNPQNKLYAQYVGIPVFTGKPGLKDIKNIKDNFGKKIIFYSGSFQLKKGLEDLIIAFSNINTNAKLILAGGRNDNEINLVNKLITKVGVSKEIEITGWLDYSSLLNILENATVGVIPLKNTFYNRYLTAPSKLFDYLSFGLPLIASDLPSIRDFVPENKNCLYYEPDNTEELSQKIDLILTDKYKYSEMQSNNRSIAEKYLWVNRSAAMLDFIRSV